MEPVVVNDVGLTWRWCTTTGQYWRTFTWALCFDYCETKTTTFSVHSRPKTIGQCHGRLMLHDLEWCYNIYCNCNCSL